ncbi:TrkA-C domain protein [Methylobacterium sp. 4-46]|uniref:SLC13 family permease n=1 Tax=unclassified Methylobacterium TaxID=2615210 RepID=UPI000152E521|nr:MULTISPECIES: SLC13 family permease [Methylobacterium]ACA15065.1 TrkA-C domain protein [Methylobacterium sp. 4-46]WFT80801.1 SLC13 family permease [Methylobacterium nodulans]
MTHQQIIACALIAGTMLLFVWGRLRYDIVAGLALLGGIASGLVPAREAFGGFSDDIVIIVASALVVSAAVARSGAVEAALRPIAPRLRSAQAQVALLVATVAVLSAFIKNIGALAIMLPIAFQLAQKGDRSPSLFLMPMSFAALLGGLVTQIGTSPNIIVARLRGELTGTPFRMFDFAPVGIGLMVAGVAFLCVGYRLLPRDRRGTPGLDAAVAISDYATEARLPQDSPFAGRTLSDLTANADGEVSVTGLVRDKTRRTVPLPDAVLRAEDRVILRGDPTALDRFIGEAGLLLDGQDRPTREEDGAEDEVGTVEAVIGPTSVLIGQSAGRIALHERFDVNLLAVSRAGKRFTERLRDIRLRTGDVIVLQGREAGLPARLRDLGLWPLAARNLPLGSARRGWITLSILAATVIAVAFSLVPVMVAFFAAALGVVLFRTLPAREAYEAIEWPILVMLGALIPVSDTLRTTGTTDLFAGWLSQLGILLPGWGAVGLIMLAAMAVTPFLNNAATVLVMAPLAASFATTLGYRPDAFLMAVAIGAGCDFLTPIGHQCNTLVMGPGGYRFGDYARLGAPLSLLVLVAGVPLILLVWPLA